MVSTRSAARASSPISVPSSFDSVSSVGVDIDSAAATQGTPPPSNKSYAVTAGINAGSGGKITIKVVEEDEDQPSPPPPISELKAWPALETKRVEKREEAGRQRSPSFEIIDKPSTWATPSKSKKMPTGTVVKIEPISPDLQALAATSHPPEPASPEDPESGLGKHARPDSPSLPSPSKESRKKRRTGRSLSGSPPPPSSTPSPTSVDDSATVLSKSPGEAELWDTMISPSSTAIRAINEATQEAAPPAAGTTAVLEPVATAASAPGIAATPTQGTTGGAMAATPATAVVEGDRRCGEAARIEAGWGNMSFNGSRVRHSLIDTNATLVFPAPSHESIFFGPTRQTSVEQPELSKIASPRPIYPQIPLNPINATKGMEDVVMLSPSPSISQIMKDRIPRHQKGKGRAIPSPGPSKPVEIVDSFFARQQDERPLGPNLFNPDDTACSVFPPQRPVNTAATTVTPVHTASIIDRYQLFESTMASRGPPISRTLYAQEFPAPTFAPPYQTPKPPQPYVEDGEIIEDDFDMASSGLRDFVQQQAENAPAEQDDFLTMMPPPQGGFPPVHFTSPLGAYVNTVDKQLLDWEREHRAGLVTMGVSFYGFGALDGDVDPRYKQLLSYAAHTLNARFHTDRIMIAKPQPKVAVTQLNAAPHTALLYGLNTDEAEILEREGVMCTTRLAMFFHRLDVAYPDYIGAIHGLTTRLIQPVYDMVLNHFLSPEAEALFRQLTSRPPNPIVPPNRAQAYFINTFYVRRLDCRARGNTHAPVYLLYMRSPATDYHSFRAWSAFCKKINLTHSLYGTGYLKTPGVCAGCHGQDHPSGLCRFASLEGWLAPPPGTPPNFTIPAPLATQEHQMQQQSRPGNANANQGRQRRRRGNGKASHVDSPRP